MFYVMSVYTNWIIVRMRLFPVLWRDFFIKAVLTILIGRFL